MYVFLLSVGVCGFLSSHAQTDSTEIKLTHYKELFMKGLITAHEYEALKQQALGISTQPVKPAIVIQNPDSVRVADSLLAVKMHYQAIVDARAYYRPSGASAGTALTSIFAGAIPFGLIPAIICSNTQPKEDNLNYPDISLFKNPDYAKSYRIESMRIKRQNTWIAWGGGLGANIAAGVVTGIIVSLTKK